MTKILTHKIAIEILAEKYGLDKVKLENTLKSFFITKRVIHQIKKGNKVILKGIGIIECSPRLTKILQNKRIAKRRESREYIRKRREGKGIYYEPLI